MVGQEARAAYGDDEPSNDNQDNQPAAARLMAFLSEPNRNLAQDLEPDKLTDIGARVIREFDIDYASCAEWRERNEEAVKLATMAPETKDYPFVGAANVKYPLITVGALQFNARAYPALIQDDRVCKCKVNGRDDDGAKAARAKRVGEYTSWQLTSEDKNWEDDTDRLTLQVSIFGSMFRKCYWDPTQKRQVSRLLTPDRLVRSYRGRSLEDVPRISEMLSLYPYEIEERIRDGRFVEFEYGQPVADPNSKDAPSADDDQAPHEFIEQHRLLDLDDDDYPEPYIVTVHKGTEKVCRIVANFDQESVTVSPDGRVIAIRKRDYYSQYVFFPSPDGGQYGMGFGSLLKSTSEAINTTLNEMLDAGHLANTQGGFISAQAGLKERSFRFSRGEFKVVNTGSVPIAQAILPIKFDGPSTVLFHLLGLLIEQGKEISSTKDVLTGDTGGKVMAPTTTLALIEQGMKVFNAIFKRIHRGLKAELVLHAKLNHKYLSPEAYNAFFDGPEQYDPKADFDLDTMDITPVSDPSISTQMQQLAQAQVAREIGAGKPYIDQQELDKRAFAAAGIEDIDKLFVKPDEKQAAFMEAMQKMTVHEAAEKINKLMTAQLKDIADAEAAEAGQQMSLYEFIRQSLNDQHGMEMDNAQVAAQPGGLPGMDGGADGSMGAPAVPPMGADNGPGAGGPVAEQLPGADTGGMGAVADQGGAN